MVKTSDKYSQLIEMEINLNKFTISFLSELIQSMNDEERKLLHGYEIDSYRHIKSIDSEIITILFNDGDTYNSALGYLTQIEASELIGYIFADIKGYNTQMSI